MIFFKFSTKSKTHDCRHHDDSHYHNTPNAFNDSNKYVFSKIRTHTHAHT